MTQSDAARLAEIRSNTVPEGFDLSNDARLLLLRLLDAAEARAAKAEAERDAAQRQLADGECERLVAEDDAEVDAHNAQTVAESFGHKRHESAVELVGYLCRELAEARKALTVERLQVALRKFAESYPKDEWPWITIDPSGLIEVVIEGVVCAGLPRFDAIPDLAAWVESQEKPKPVKLRTFRCQRLGEKYPDRIGVIKANGAVTLLQEWSVETEHFNYLDAVVESGQYTPPVFDDEEASDG